MRVLIVEDEMPAAAKLRLMIEQYDPETAIAGICTSVNETVEWLSNPENHADLLFLDIQLSDGSSFDIFDRVEVNKPVIFITAFNEYAIKAFKVNSIDYLLKPLVYDDLYNSLEKIKVLRENLPPSRERFQYNEISRLLLQMNRSFKNRFLVKIGDHFRSVMSVNIAFFCAEGRTVFLITTKQNKYVIDFTLEQLESVLDPDMFFRPNRSYIINIGSIRDVVMYSNSRLLIQLNQDFEGEIIVSRERVAPLKIWLEGLK